MSTQPIIPAGHVPLIDTDGSPAFVPQENLQTALGRGFKQATVMTDPDNNMTFVPKENAGKALRRGFSVGPPSQRNAVGSQLSNRVNPGNWTANAPAQNLALGVASGAGFPESEHPVKDLAKSFAAPNEDLAKQREATSQYDPANDPEVSPEMRQWYREHPNPKPGGIQMPNLNIAPLRAVERASDAQIEGAKQAWKAGSPTSAIIRGVSAAIPIIGPAAENAGEEIGQGIQEKDADKVAHGVGQGVGQIATLGLMRKSKTPISETESAANASKSTATASPQSTGATAQTPKPSQTVGGKLLDTVTSSGPIKKLTSAAQQGKQVLQEAVNPMAKVENLTPEAAAIKATKPRNSIQNVKEQVSSALQDSRRAADSKGLQVKTLDDANNALLEAKKQVWQEYTDAAGPNKNVMLDGNKIADAMEGTINKRFEAQNPNAAQAIRDKAAQYRAMGNGTGQMSLADAEDYLKSANNELNSYYAKNKVSQRQAAIDPSTGHTVAEANELRNQLNSKLQDITGVDTAAIRKRYGALNTFEDIINRRINVAERAAPESLIEQMGKLQTVAQAGEGLFKIGTGRFREGASDIKNAVMTKRAAEASRAANDPNFLIGKAFEKTTPRPAYQQPSFIQSLTGKQQPLPQSPGPLFNLQQTPVQPIARPSFLQNVGQQQPTPIPPSRQLGPMRLSQSTSVPSNIEPVGIPQTAEASAVQNRITSRSQTGLSPELEQHIMNKAMKGGSPQKAQAPLNETIGTLTKYASDATRLGDKNALIDAQVKLTNRLMKEKGFSPEKANTEADRIIKQAVNPQSPKPTQSTSLPYFLKMPMSQ